MAAPDYSVERKLIVEIGKPHDPVLNEFLFDRSRFSSIMGPLGSAKTTTAIEKMWLIMNEQEPNPDGIRPTRWAVVRNTYPDLTTSTIKDFLEFFEPFGEMKNMGGGTEPPHFNVNVLLPDGTRVESEVIFIALDREDQVKKLRGTQFTGFWFNEIKELVKAIIDQADLRHGRFPSMKSMQVKATWHGIIGDTNACDTDHHYYKWAEEETPEGWTFFRQPGGVLRTGERNDLGREVWKVNYEAENLRNLPEAYYERGMAGKDDDWIAVELANEYGFVSDGDPVHPQYIDSLHCTKEEIPYNPKWPIILGVDFGRTPAAAIYQRDPNWGRWLLIDEFVTTDMSQAVFGPELRRYLGQHYPGASVRAWGDPAGDGGNDATEQTAIQVLNVHIPCEPAPTNSITLRRAALVNPMLRICGDGRPAWLISPKAQKTRKGFQGGFCYRRLKVAGSERYTKEPDKNEWSHPCEAAEYAPLSEGEGEAAILPSEHYDAEGPEQEYADFD